ncbi:MAG: hypothetical protein AAF542_06195 [Pseudomonadota bacterium]
MFNKAINLTRILPLALSGLLIPHSLSAQEAMFSIEPVSMGMGMVGDFVSTELVQNSPLSAEITVRTVQTLADGNRIVNEDRTRLIRDSAGRVRREHDIADNSAAAIVSITDPRSKTSFMLDTEKQEIIRMPEFGHDVFFQEMEGMMPEEMSDPDGNAVIIDHGMIEMEQEGFFMPPPVPMAMGLPAHSSAFVMPFDGNAEEKSLGEDVISGHRVQGTLHTTTFAAGSFGNERPIVVTRETWYAPELKMMLKTEESDPRAGTLSYSVKILSTDEPDPALFTLPSDFQLMDLPLPPEFSK